MHFKTKWQRNRNILKFNFITSSNACSSVPNRAFFEAPSSLSSTNSDDNSLNLFWVPGSLLPVWEHDEDAGKVDEDSLLSKFLLCKGERGFSELCLGGTSARGSSSSRESLKIN